MSLNAEYMVLGKGDLWIGHDRKQVVGKTKDKDLKGKARKVIYREISKDSKDGQAHQIEVDE